MPRIIAAIATAIVICGIWQIFSAGVLATSLNGFYFAYIYLVHHDLGLPTEAKVGPQLDAEFCGGAGIELQLLKQPNERQCLPLPPVRPGTGPCDPVAAEGHIPDYVYALSDHLTTRMAVVADDVGKIAKHLQTATRDDLLAAGTFEGRAEVAGQRSKVVTLKQCDGYGYIDINQNYYDGVMPGWLRH